MKMGNSGMPYDNNKNIHEAYGGGWDLGHKKNLFGSKFWHKNLLYWFPLKS